MLRMGEILAKIALNEMLTNAEREKLRVYGNELEFNRRTSDTFISIDEGDGIEWPPADNRYYVAHNAAWAELPYPYYQKLTSQVNGSATHFDYTIASHNIIIAINGLVQGEDDFIYDFDGLGFTLDTTLVSGDELEIWIFPGGVLGDPAYLFWDKTTITGLDTVLSSFADYACTIPATGNLAASMKIAASFVGDAATKLSCYALDGVTRVLTGMVTTDAEYIYVAFPTAIDVAVTGFELALEGGGALSLTPLTLNAPAVGATAQLSADTWGAGSSMTASTTKVATLPADGYAKYTFSGTNTCPPGAFQGYLNGWYFDLTCTCDVGANGYTYAYIELNSSSNDTTIEHAAPYAYGPVNTPVLLAYAITSSGLVAAPIRYHILANNDTAVISGSVSLYYSSTPVLSDRSVTIRQTELYRITA